MSIPENTQQATQWGADAVFLCYGPEGGPFTIVDTGTPLPVTFGGSGAGDLEVQGDVAQYSTDSGNPVKVGGVGHNALIANVADGQRVNAMFDLFGRQITVPQGPRDIVTDATTTINNSTSETTVLAAINSVYLDLVTVWVANTSNSAVRVDFRDTTGGSVRFSLYIPAGDMRGFTPQVPVKQSNWNTNWTAQSSASVSDLRVYVQAVKNK